MTSTRAVPSSAQSGANGEITTNLDYRTKVFYGVGGIANAVKTVLFGLFTLYFYTSVMGLPGTLVGIASAVGLVWDAAIDPYIGYLSDRSGLWFGRRHTFMLLGAVTMGASFWVFFSPPPGLSSTGLFAWLLGSSLLVRTATSIYGIPYFALGAELSSDYHERTSVTAVRGFLALLGTLAAASLSFKVFSPGTVSGTAATLDYRAYPFIGLIFGLVMTVAGLIATFGTRTRRSDVRVDDRTDKSETLRHFLAGLAQSLRNASFRVLFASVFFFFLGVVINISLSIHYYTYYVEISDSVVLSRFQLFFYVGALFGTAFWLALSRVIEKHWLYNSAALVTAVLTFLPLLLLGEGRPFGTGNALPVMIGHGFAGFFASVLWFVPGSMVADVADEDELVTGQRREGSFFGILVFGQQLAGGVSALLAGTALDWFAGLVPGQAQQSALTTQRIALLYTVLPAVFLLTSAGLTLRYSLGRSRIAQIQRELNRRRAILPDQRPVHSAGSGVKRIFKKLGVRTDG